MTNFPAKVLGAEISEAFQRFQRSAGRPLDISQLGESRQSEYQEQSFHIFTLHRGENLSCDCNFILLHILTFMRVFLLNIDLSVTVFFHGLLSLCVRSRPL